MSSGPVNLAGYDWEPYDALYSTHQGGWVCPQRIKEKWGRGGQQAELELTWDIVSVTVLLCMYTIYLNHNYVCDDSPDNNGVQNNVDKNRTLLYCK